MWEVSSLRTSCFPESFICTAAAVLMKIGVHSWIQLCTQLLLRANERLRSASGGRSLVEDGEALSLV